MTHSKRRAEMGTDIYDHVSKRLELVCTVVELRSPFAAKLTQEVVLGGLVLTKLVL